MREAFERAILEAPHDRATWSAYADWLADQGDPRGELMQVQLALEDEALPSDERARLSEREAALLGAHQAEWLGPLAPHLLGAETVTDYSVGYPGREVSNYRWRFARGLLDTLLIRNLYVPMARALRDAPQTRFLRALGIDYVAAEPDPDEERDGPPRHSYPPGPDVPTFEADRIQFVAIFPLTGTPEFSNLRYLRVGAEVDMDRCMTAGHLSHHTYCNPAADLVEKMPRLEELHLLCKDFDPEPVFACRSLTQLRVLRVYHLGKDGANRRQSGEREHPEYPLATLAANPALANLTHLLFHPHHEEFGTGSFLPLKQVRALLASKHLNKLTHLQLRLSNMGDEGCAALVASGILRRLRWLDLRHGCITDEGARLLAGCPDLRNLLHLDLCRNGLTHVGIEALRATGVPLRAERQQTEGELADEQYLREGDFE